MEKIKIQNFKCFKNASISLNNLTVFAGGNGNGKSTIIQSLLLLRSTIEQYGSFIEDKGTYEFEKFNTTELNLNGPYGLALGTTSMILPVNTDEQIISIAIEKGGKKFQTSFDVSDKDKLYLTPLSFENVDFDNSSVFKKEFYYLNSERLGPRIKNEIKNTEFAHTGYRGELSAQILGNTDFSYKFKVKENRWFPETKSAQIGIQVNYWMDFIFPGVQISSTFDIRTLSAQIKTQNYISQGEEIITTNVGFGISYALPIIISGLIAKSNSYLIIENPEAHLHPSAQSRIGFFLALIANSGVRVIIETHSDHLLNGIQLAVAQNKIDQNLTTVNYLNQEKDADQPEIIEIKINKMGELSKWPNGFFDQSQRDLAQLFQARASKK